MMIPLVLLAIASATAQEPPVAHWKLDGDAEPGGKARGRAYFVDSPIGATGKTLVLNGVDAYVEIEPAGTLGVGAGDFTLSAWICPLEMRDVAILSRTKAWMLGMNENGALRFVSREGELITRREQVSAHRWFHVAVTVQRSEKDTLSALWVNGEKVATACIRPGDLDPPKEALTFGRWPQVIMGGGASERQYFYCGLLDDLRLYGKSLDGHGISDLADEGLPWIRSRERGRSPFEGRFALAVGEVVAFAGGENVLAMQEGGHLEAILSASAPQSRLLFRCLAWEGDTVYEQLRPLNFGTWRDQLSRAGAGVIFAQFGAMEALEGKAGLDRFEAAYDKLLGEFTEATKRIVVISPTPYERPTAPLPDLSGRNEDLRLYVDSMRKIAAGRKALFVDLFGVRWENSFTRDGIHPTETGHAAVAREIARQLGVTATEPSEDFRRAIRRKNRIWLDYWRPSNWAFLNGDRIEQPSSRDHADKRVRWFPVELQQKLALIRREEAALQKRVEAGR